MIRITIRGGNLMFYTCLVGPLSYEAWVCGKLWIALTTPFGESKGSELLCRKPYVV